MQTHRLESIQQIKQTLPTKLTPNFNIYSVIRHTYMAK